MGEGVRAVPPFGSKLKAVPLIRNSSAPTCYPVTICVEAIPFGLADARADTDAGRFVPPFCPSDGIFVQQSPGRLLRGGRPESAPEARSRRGRQRRARPFWDPSLLSAAIPSHPVVSR